MDEKTKKYIMGSGGIISIFVYIPISFFLVKNLFSKIKITPNQITALSIVFGILSVIFFLFGNWIWFIIGSITLQTSYIFDCADGQLARLKNMQSDFGATLDFISDLAVEFPLYFAITFGLYRQFNTVWIWILGFTVIYGIFMTHYLLRYLDTVQTSSKGYTHTTPRDIMKDTLERVSRGAIHLKREYTYFGGGTNYFLIFLGAIFYSITPYGILNSMCLVLLFMAIIYNFHWISQFLISLKNLKKAQDE